MKKINIVSLVFLSLLFIPIVTSASLNTNLSYGLQNNSDVKELQEYLIGKGFLTGSATGNFYSLTLNAVKKYQASQNLSKSGYVGILTRTAINKELASSLSASNQEATTETGTKPSVPEPQKTTNDVVTTLQAQIALLQKQLNALNTQQTTTQQIQQQVQQQAQTIQQIQQNTQQIAQNITPAPTPTPTPAPAPTCTPNWQCSAYNTCTNYIQARTCNDLNSCNTNVGKPAVNQSCSMSTPAPAISTPKVCKDATIQIREEDSQDVAVLKSYSNPLIVGNDWKPAILFNIIRFFVADTDTGTNGSMISKIVITRDGGSDEMFSKVSLWDGDRKETDWLPLSSGKVEFTSTTAGQLGGDMRIMATLNMDKIPNGTKLRLGVSSLSDIVAQSLCPNLENPEISNGTNPNVFLYPNSGNLMGHYRTITE